MNNIGGNSPIGHTQTGQNTNPAQDVAAKRFSGFKVSFLAGVSKLLGLRSSKAEGKPIGSRKIESVPARPSLSTKGAERSEFSSSNKLGNETLNHLKNDPAIRNSFNRVNTAFENLKTAKENFAKVREERRGGTGREEARMELQVAKRQFKETVNKFNKLSEHVQPNLLDAADLETVAAKQNALKNNQPGDDLSADEQRAGFHLSNLKIALLSRPAAGTAKSPRG